MIKKILAKLVLVLGFFLIIGPSGVWAKSYSIDQVEIDSKVNIDGSMDVQEKRIFNFDGDYTFAYQEIEKMGQRKEPYILENISFCDETKCYQQVSKNSGSVTNKTPGTFYVDELSNSYYIKWFYRANSSKKTFILKYKVTNAVQLHQDTAEIYWQFVGDKWETSQRNIKVQMSLPPGVDGSKIKAWGHGPLNGVVAISKENLVTFESTRLGLETFLEGRVVLPKEVFKKGVLGEGTLASIENEENNFIEKTKSDIEKETKTAKNQILS